MSWQDIVPCVTSDGDMPEEALLRMVSTKYAIKCLSFKPVPDAEDPKAMIAKVYALLSEIEGVLPVRLSDARPCQDPGNLMPKRKYRSTASSTSSGPAQQAAGPVRQRPDPAEPLRREEAGAALLLPGRLPQERQDRQDPAGRPGQNEAVGAPSHGGLVRRARRADRGRPQRGPRGPHRPVHPGPRPRSSGTRPSTRSCWASSTPRASPAY